MYTIISNDRQINYYFFFVKKYIQLIKERIGNNISNNKELNNDNNNCNNLFFV